MGGDWFFPQNKFYGYENLAFQARKNPKKIYILVKKIDIGSSNNMFAFA
jgi:hypothetical protein